MVDDEHQVDLGPETGCVALPLLIASFCGLLAIILGAYSVSVDDFYRPRNVTQFPYFGYSAKR
jgi:hypothetical protein